MNHYIGNKVYQVEEVPSTNTYAIELLNKGIIDYGNIVIADNQYIGKGQGNNKWISEPGKNLTFSLLINPTFVPPEKQFYLTIFVTLSLYDMLSNLVNNIEIKWPNDLYYKNKKLCGILIENVISGHVIATSAIGVGLNVNQTIFPEFLPNPISLALIRQSFVNKNELLQQFIEKANIRYRQLKRLDFTTLIKQYEACLYLRNENHEFDSVKGKIKGKIIGVNDYGELIFMKEGDDSLLFFSFKEITFPQLRN